MTMCCYSRGLRWSPLVYTWTFFIENISPVSLADTEAEVPSSGKFCGYGATEDNTGPGETLNCYNVDVEQNDEGNLVASSEEGAATQYDVGAALVSEGVQYGVLVAPPGEEDGSAGAFIKISSYLDWISSETGIGAVNDFDSDVIGY